MFETDQRLNSCLREAIWLIGAKDYDNAASLIAHVQYILVKRKAAQQSVHADGWILTVKYIWSNILFFFRVARELRPSSRR